MRKLAVADVIFSIADTPTVPVDTVLNEVATFHGVSVEAIRSPSHYHKHTLPRYEAMWLLRTLRRLSYRIIGTHFGNRDHSTVVHGVKLINKHIAHERVEGDDIIVLMEKFPNVSW